MNIENLPIWLQKANTDNDPENCFGNWEISSKKDISITQNEVIEKIYWNLQIAQKDLQHFHSHNLIHIPYGLFLIFFSNSKRKSQIQFALENVNNVLYLLTVKPPT